MSSLFLISSNLSTYMTLADRILLCLHPMQPPTELQVQIRENWLRDGVAAEQYHFLLVCCINLSIESQVFPYWLKYL